MCLDGAAVCEPKDVPANGYDWIEVQEVLLGCWTDFIRPDGAEVHVISLVKKIHPINTMLFIFIIPAVLLKPTISIFGDLSL